MGFWTNGLLRAEPVDRPLERDGVEPAARVLAERGQAGDLGQPADRLARRAPPRPQRRGADVPLAEVAVDVAAAQRRQLRVAHDVAARDRAVALRMRVLDDRRARAGRALVGEVAPRALERAPAPVDAAPAAAAGEVDLLHGVLPDVADDEVARATVERVAPRVAEAVGVDLGPGAGAARERVRRRD